MKVISTTNTELVRKTAKSFGVKPLKPFYTKFNDGEPYLRLEGNFKNENIIVIQCLNKPIPQNLIRLFLLLEALSRQKPKNIILVLSFCAFRRQDKIVKRGEGVPFQMLFRLLAIFPIKKIITVDLHSVKSLPSIVYNIETATFFAEYFGNKKIDLVLSPDEGSINRCTRLAKLLKSQMRFVKKHREGYKISIQRCFFLKEHKLSKQSQSILIYDDEIDTGNTILKLMNLIPRSSKIYVAASHGVFSKINRKIFKRATEVCITNSISQHFSFSNLKILSIHEIVYDCIKNQLK